MTGRLAGGFDISVAGQTMEIEKGKMLSHVMVSLDGVDGKKTGNYKRKIREALNGCGGESRTALTYAGKIESGLNSVELLTGAERMMDQAGPASRESGERRPGRLDGFEPRLMATCVTTIKKSTLT